jgi:hypothetical protein
MAQSDDPFDGGRGAEEVVAGSAALIPAEEPPIGAPTEASRSASQPATFHALSRRCAGACARPPCPSARPRGGPERREGRHGALAFGQSRPDRK